MREAHLSHYEFHVCNGEDEHGEAVSWYDEAGESKALAEARALSKDGDLHCVVKALYFFTGYEVIQVFAS